MRNKDILSYAQEILRRADAESPRVDLMKIARWAGVKVLAHSCTNNSLSDNELGKLLSDGEHWYIVYRDTCEPETKRFTVAHELGHLFLKHAEEKYKLATKHEKQADMFASCLLYHTTNSTHGGINYVNENTRK